MVAQTNPLISLTPIWLDICLLRCCCNCDALTVGSIPQSPNHYIKGSDLWNERIFPHKFRRFYDRNALRFGHCSHHFIYGQRRCRSVPSDLSSDLSSNQFSLNICFLSVVEPMIMIGMAYCSFLTADLFKCSGIISIVGCGLVWVVPLTGVNLAIALTQSIIFP